MDCKEEGGACPGDKSCCFRTDRQDNGNTHNGTGRSGSQKHSENCQIDGKGYKLMFMQLLTGIAYAAPDIAAPYQRTGDSVMDMIFNAGPMVKFVLLILMALSVACWCVIVLKYRMIRRARRESNDFISLFRQRKNYSALYRDSEKLEDSHLAQIFRVGYAELSRLGKSLETRNLIELSSNPEIMLENVERAIQGGMTAERQRFERFLPLLATTGSTAPFIGLFGTVWGI